MKALIIGGTSNIGSAIVKELIAQGYEVIYTYSANEKKAKILNAQYKTKSYKVDIKKEDEVSTLFNEVKNLDLLVIVSGVFSLSMQQDLEVSNFDKLMDINVKGPFLCTKHSISSLNTNSSIINIASINAFHPGFGQTAHYDASKGFIVSYTQSLAAELAPNGIRVNSIAPGLIEAEYLHEEDNPVLKMFTERAVLKTTVKVEDIASTVTFLASNKAIDGQCIVVDCGYLIG